MAKEVRRPRPEDDSVATLAARCADGLEALYASARAAGADPAVAYSNSVKYIIRMLAVLIAAERIPPDRSAFEPMQRASDAIIAAAGESASREYEDAAADAYAATDLGIFAPCELSFDSKAFALAAQTLVRPRPDAPIERIFFETMPLSWLGSVYQHLLTIHPDETGEQLEINRSVRKGRGVFFTPPALVSYIVEGVLTPIIDSHAEMLHDGSITERLAEIKVLDPSMGGGDFLSRAIDFLSAQHPEPVEGRDDYGQSQTQPSEHPDRSSQPQPSEHPELVEGRSEGGQPMTQRARLAANCVFGVDVDPETVEVARFSVWASSAFADGISKALNSHMVCGNALAARHADEAPFDWVSAFPSAFSQCGFDAVIGNPPYIAAKNGLTGRSSGQSDSYLMFLSEIMGSNLVRPDGLFSMVLPDPMLVRENAAEIRRKLAKDWSIISLLHISEAFPDALVANVVPICRNSPPSSPTFDAIRIERAADRHAFMQRPRRTAHDLRNPVRLETIVAQDRCEFLYLLEQGGFGEIITRIHGEKAALSNYEEPFVPLRKLNVKAIYRGEEVGKSAINREAGDHPILLGGQSIQPFEILWEGRTAGSSWAKKPLERYHSTKVLIQKSSARLIAALDRTSKRHIGYLFPQSVYAVELAEHGIDPWYLLCILNSQVMNEYIWRTVTGYKLLQPQLELEDIRALPIRHISFTTHVSHREAEVVRGIAIFESESLRMGDFPQLANFVVTRLMANPEESDVVHDVLSHLGRVMVDLTRSNRKSPEADKTRRLEVTRRAIETIVWRLYCSDPTQMALPW